MRTFSSRLITRSLHQTCALAASLLISFQASSHAQVIWDGGAASNQWGDALNWSTDSVPNSASTDVQFENNIAPSSISFNSPGSFNRTVGNITMASTQTNDLTLNNDSSNRLTLGSGDSVTLQSGSGDLSFSRLSTAGASTFTTNDASQVIFAAIESTGTINISGAGVTRMSFINPGQANRSLNINSGATLELAGDLTLFGGNNNNVTNILNGSGTLRASGSVDRLAAFGRKGGGVSSFSGTIEDGASAAINFQLGHITTDTNGAGSSAYTGTQTLSGNNTYTGTTVVNQGTLLVNGTTSGQGNYLIRGTTTAGSAASGTLGGTGTIGLANAATFTVGDVGQLTGSSGILRPGADNTDTGLLILGTALNNNEVIFTQGSILRLDIGTFSQSDRLDIFGDLTIGATATTLDLLSLSGAWDGSTYTLISWTGTQSGTFSSVLGLDSGYQINYLSNAITLSAIPEPSTYAILSLGLGVLWVLHRKRTER